MTIVLGFGPVCIALEAVTNIIAVLLRILSGTVREHLREFSEFQGASRDILDSLMLQFRKNSYSLAFICHDFGLNLVPLPPEDLLTSS